MRKVECYAMMVGAVLALGACSDSYDPTPSASGVFPAEGFIGRTVRVEISGEETKWADGATVSFGDGVTVSNVVVASESDIFADLDIASTAALTDRDVTVTSGKETDTLKTAFRVQSPIEITFGGQAAQGSISTFTVKNHDFDTPFDTTTTGDGFLTPITFTNITLDGGPGVALQLNTVTAFSITGFALIDVDAPASTPIQVVSGPAGGTQVTSSLGAPLMIAARTPTALVSDTPASGAIDMAGLYTFTPASTPALASLSVSGNGPSGGTQLAILPSSGHFSDLLSAGASTNQVVKTGMLYAIPYDLSGDAGYNYQLTTHGAALTAIAEGEPGNNTAVGAVTVTSGALIDNATLTDDTDEDWFKITVAAGKSIHVVTAPGDAGCDTLVDVYGPNSPTTQYDESSDANYHEDLTTAATTTAGTYYIKISASQQGFFDPSQNHYLGAIILE